MCIIIYLFLYVLCENLDVRVRNRDGEALSWVAEGIASDVVQVAAFLSLVFVVLRILSHTLLCSFLHLPCFGVCMFKYLVLVCSLHLKLLSLPWKCDLIGKFHAVQQIL